MKLAALIIATIILLLLIWGFSTNWGRGKIEPSNVEQQKQEVQVTLEDNQVTLENFSFRPMKVTVKKGTVVTWTNKDSVSHTVTSDTGAFGSGLLSQNQTYQFTFDKEGMFPYHCSPHPQMRGEVQVLP